MHLQYKNRVCGGDVSPSPGEVDLGCETDEDCAAYEICEEEECTTGDRSDGFSDAEDIVASHGRGQFGLWTINLDGDKDYWRYVSSEVHPGDRRQDPRGHTRDALVPDLFLALRSGRSGHQRRWLRQRVVSTRTPCCTRTWAGGDYVLMIQGATARNSRGALSGPDYGYRMEVRQQVRRVTRLQHGRTHPLRRVGL